MTSKNKILSLLLMLLPGTLFAQWIPDKLLSSPVLSENDSNKFVFSVDMTGFFKNNEYFSPVAKGGTLPGIHLLPKVAYQFDNRFRAELGAYNVYYSGDQQKQGVYAFNSLFVRLQYALNPDFNLIFGNIYGGLNHRLIEPLYQWEHQFIDKPESGLQLIYRNKRYSADVWVNWQRFIEHGDSVPEVLTFGTSASAKLTNPENRFQLSIPFQLLIYHRGGQIDTSDEPMVVMGNAVTGVCSEWKFEKSFIRSISLSTYLAGYYDKLPNREVRPFTNGWGIYPVFQVNTSLFSFMTGYWYAKNFYALEGEPLFGSFNPYDPQQQMPTRKLITAKFAYSQQILKPLSIGAQVETYTDLGSKSTDYSFGVYLQFKGDFTLKTLQK
uniref:hypothetical protein n=1 Tax=uncultured Bacteroides sp. TaxID=162156 RepID=UPI0025E161C1|nr:hypothetical protein [uncultured Bacteroides sp.]